MPRPFDLQSLPSMMMSMNISTKPPPPPSEGETSSESVVEALKRTPKGQLVYDSAWEEEGRTQDIINQVKTELTSLRITPSKLSSKFRSDESLTDSPNAYQFKSQSNKERVRRFLDLGKKENETVCEFSPRKIEHNVSSPSLLESSTRSIDKELLAPLPEEDISFKTYEQRREAQLHAKISRHRESVESQLKELEEEAENELKLIRQRFLLQTLKKQKQFELEYQELYAELSSKQAQLESRSHEEASRASERLKKILTKDKETKLLEIATQKQIILQVAANLDKLLTQLLPIQAAHQISQRLIEKQRLLQDSLAQIDHIASKNEINEEDLERVNRLKELAEQVNDELRTLSKTIKDLIEQQRQRQDQTSKQEPPKEESSRVDSISKSSAHVKPSQSVQTPSTPSKVHDRQESDSGFELKGHVQKDSFSAYVQLQKFSSDFESSYKSIIENDKHKYYRNQLQIFIKTQINAISSGTPEHLRDRLSKLSLLFEGRNIEFQDKQINVKGHPEAKAFSMHFAAKTFIGVATKQIISVPKAAYSMAAVIVVLWSRFPEFGTLMLGTLFEKCPYLVPYYPKKEPDEDVKTHLIACGYSLGGDGKSLESEEMWLNKMRALVRLYGGIIQCSLGPNHPYGIGMGWSFVARILNLEPRPSITAAVIHAFLSTTAHKMSSTYRDQFIKMLKFIDKDYIKRIETLTTENKQSLAQLKLLLEDFFKKLRRGPVISSPEGLVPDYFWQPQFLSGRSSAF